MWGLVTIVLLSAASVLLWLSYGFVASYSLFGASAWPVLIHAGAAIATAVLVVLLFGQSVLRFAFPRWLRTDPTDLQRSLVYAALSFAAVAIVLGHFGFDPTTILTTSAIITAVVGLSIQPMLGSLLSGLTVARAVRIGDGVMHDGKTIEVTALNWRSIVGKRGDGGTVIIPNAQLANGTLVIFPRDRSARAEVSVEVPANLPPHRLHELVRATLLEFPEVDPVKKVAFKPLPMQPDLYPSDRSFARYHVEFWVRLYKKRGDIEEALLQRLWYVFQREQIVSHRGAAREAENSELLPEVTAALRAAGSAEAALLAAQPERTLETGDLLSFGAGERIEFPARLSGRIGLLVNGELREAGSAAGEVRRSNAAWLERIEHQLTQHIGPFSAYAVREAAAGGATALQVCNIVAREIDDPETQARFIRAVDPPSDVTYRSGYLIQPPTDAKPALCAVEHALILALPEPPRGDAGPKAKRSNRPTPIG